jgi:hypothetical protein
MRDAISFYLLYRTGDTSGNYNGYIHQFFSNKKHKLSFFGSLKPGIDFILYNAWLDGGLFNKYSPVWDKNSKYGSLTKTLPVVESLEFKVVGGFHRFSMSFTQTFLSREYKGVFRPAWGNISLHFSW